MERDPKSPEKSPKKLDKTAGGESPAAAAVEPYEPPKLLKFEKLEKLIVSGE